MALMNARHAALAAVLGASLALSACTVSEVRMSPDFGQAVRQDVAAQIADPDARYEGTPAPGSSGPRAALAQKRYDKGQVLQPSTSTASTGNKSIEAGGSNQGSAGLTN